MNQKIRSGSTDCKSLSGTQRPQCAFHEQRTALLEAEILQVYSHCRDTA
jgi:hypothetical protein